MKGREHTDKETDEMHGKTHQILTEQLSLYKELLDCDTMEPSTAADVDLVMANDHGSKEELKPPVLRQCLSRGSKSTPCCTQRVQDSVTRWARQRETWV